MSNIPRVLTALLPLTLVFACADDSTVEAPGDTGTDTGTETGDGDGDPAAGDGDGDGDTAGDGDGDTAGDGDGDTAGDGDGDTAGDGDGDTAGDGDGDMTGDGDGDMTGDGDGDMPGGDAMLRVLHLGLDAPPVDIWLDDGMMPVVEGMVFEEGTDYLPVPAGVHTVSITAAGEPIEQAVLVIDPLDLAADTKYSAVAYNYLAELSALALVDDDAMIDPANTRVQVTHAAPDVGQVDIWALTDPPVLLVENLDFGTSQTIEILAGPAPVGIDVDDDMVPDLMFDVPDLGAGNFVDVYAVNEAGGAPAFLLGHMPDGSTARIDPIMLAECGNDMIEGPELCDGMDVGSCADLNFEWGTPVCSDTCDAVLGCWSNPGPDWGDDFEAEGGLVGWWTTAGEALPFQSAVMPNGGMFCAENGDIDDDETSGMLVNLDYANDGDVTFSYRVSTEEGWDFLRFYIDGVEQLAESGDIPWTETTFPVLAGQHTLEWVYEKDGSEFDLDDTVWIDDITTTGGAQAFMP